MKVTYIHHSSFMAELEHAALLFDYFEGEIPAVEGDKPPAWRPFFPRYL